MMSIRWTLATVMLLMLGTMAAALAQEDLDRAAAEQMLNERIQRFMDMGMEREAATLIAVLSESGMSPAEILLTMMMADRGGDDAGGLMLLMNAMRNAAPRQPVVIDRGEQLLVFEDGRLHVIDLQAMKVTATLDYAQTGRDDEALWRYLIPIMGHGPRQPGGEEAEVCRLHLRTLGGAIERYVAAHGALPDDTWVTQITPLLGDAQDALRCPSRDRAVAFAMNEKLLGVAPDGVTEPAETILLFETALDDANPVGGPDALPEEGVHDGGVNVLLVNGEVAWLSLAEARELLGLPIAR